MNKVFSFPSLQCDIILSVEVNPENFTHTRTVSPFLLHRFFSWNNRRTYGESANDIKNFSYFLSPFPLFLCREVVKTTIFSLHNLAQQSLTLNLESMMNFAPDMRVRICVHQSIKIWFNTKNFLVEESVGVSKGSSEDFDFTIRGHDAGCSSHTKWLRSLCCCIFTESKT